MKIFALSGSLRADSYNTALLRLADDVAGSEVTFDIATPGGLPLYDGDIEAQGIPESVAALGARAAAADAVIISTPEYNYSVPGGLKNAIDWLSRLKPVPLARKPMAIMSATPGRSGGARVQYQLRHALLFLDPDMVNKPEVMVSGAVGALAAPSDMLKDLIGQQIAALREKAGK